MREQTRPTGRILALQQIRATEAARIIGMLDVSELPSLARQWVLDGVDEHSAWELGQLDPDDDPGGGQRAALVAALADECGITFDTVQQARAVHAGTVLVQMAFAPDPGSVVFAFSNNYTDHLSARLRGAVGRLFWRRERR